MVSVLHFPEFSRLEYPYPTAKQTRRPLTRTHCPQFILGRVAPSLREHPSMKSTKFSEFLIPSPLVRIWN